MTADQTAAVVMEGVLTVSIAFIVNAMLDSKAETVKLVSYSFSFEFNSNISKAETVRLVRLIVNKISGRERI